MVQQVHVPAAGMLDVRGGEGLLLAAAAAIPAAAAALELAFPATTTANRTTFTATCMLQEARSVL